MYKEPYTRIPLDGFTKYYSAFGERKLLYSLT